MIGFDLLRRFFVRFCLALVLAMGAMILLVHIFQKQLINTEWSADLREGSHWLALHSDSLQYEALANAWGKTHDRVRIAFLDPEGKLLADSHADRPLLDAEAIRRGEGLSGSLLAWDETKEGVIVVMTRPMIPAFPHGLRWELVAAAVGIAVLVLVFVYPLVRSLARVFARMTEIAQQVSAGHFGRTLGIRRPGELGTLIEAFDDMSKKLADAEKLNTRLLHDVSHELRSPLGRIQVMAQTITHRPEEGGECIRGICEEVALLDRLVGDLLQTARFEARSETTTFTRFEVVAWARETLGRLEAKARSRGVTFSAHFPGEEKMASGDPQRLAQAVGNLVDNAVDALRDHAAGRIEATLSLGDDRWSVSVRDNGPGIPEADQPHVFRRFYRVGQDRSRDRGGVGLGLSLVRAIAVAHGGRAILDSRPGHGTVVTLELPIAPEGLAEADASGKPTLS